MTFMTRSFISAAALGLAALSAAANANQLAEVKARGALICGTQNASPPYGYQDPTTRDYVGYDVDMCKAIARHMGVAMQHKPVSTEARIPEVKLGRVDVMTGAMSYMPARAEQVDFSLQYLQGYIKVLVKADSGLKTLADLAGKKVCASSGSSSAAVAQRVIKDATILTFQNVAQCYSGVQSGRTVGMTAGELVLRRFINDSKNTSTPMALIEEPTYIEHIGAVVKPGETELLAEVNKAILAMDKSGELDQIFEKWLGATSIYGMKRDFKVIPVAEAAQADAK